MDSIPPSRSALAEALALSGEIVQNLELGEIPLASVALKASRLARLLNDFDMQKAMGYEVGGYPSGSDGIAADVWSLARIAGRVYRTADSKTKKAKEKAYVESIGELEEKIKTLQLSLTALNCPNTDSMGAVMTVMNQRTAATQVIGVASQRLSARRAFFYDYVLRKYYELKFSSVANGVFERVRQRVDPRIGALVPDAVRRFTAVYDNLGSENPEDWSNAVHSCRRILQDLADALYPATSQKRVVTYEGKTKTVLLGRDQYINRLVAFVEESSDSERLQHLVGSHLRFLGDRLDAVFQAAQKGSHATILSREEADRYVIYTYLLVGDILALRDAPFEAAVQDDTGLHSLPEGRALVRESGETEP
ncbi:MAG: AbiTii domain-containing protein [Chloroflexota bacterium]